MPWVQRDGSNNIIAKFARQQLGIADEYLAPDHPDLQPSLDDLKAARIDDMKDDITRYIYSRYDEEAQSTLEALLSAANANGQVNRVAHIKQSIDWLETVLAELYTKKDSMLAAVDETALNAITWDWSTFDATDPLVTIESAIAITN